MDTNSIDGHGIDCTDYGRDFDEYWIDYER